MGFSQGLAQLSQGSSVPPPQPRNERRGQGEGTGHRDPPQSSLHLPWEDRRQIVAKLEESSCAAIAGSVSGTSKKIFFIKYNCC